MRVEGVGIGMVGLMCGREWVRSVCRWWGESGRGIEKGV